MEKELPELTSRQRAILAAVVEEYTRESGPISSSRVAARRDIKVSPATVRNTMARLEKLGLLIKPHASAGRIPSDKGLLLHIQSLGQRENISPAEKQSVDLQLRRKPGAAPLAPELISQAAKVLSLLTEQATLATSPRLKRITLDHIEFVRLSDFQALAILVGRGGVIFQKPVAVDFQLQSNDLERYSNYLNAHLTGRTLPAVRKRIKAELASEKASYDQFSRRALSLGGEVIASLDEDDDAGVSLVLDGLSKALKDPELNAEDIRALTFALEDKRRILMLLDATLKKSNVFVHFGDEESSMPKNTALVAAPYSGPHGLSGSLAVVGPKRMNYGRVISLLSYTAKTISEDFSDSDAEN